MGRNVWMMDVAYTKIGGDSHYVSHISVKASNRQEAWKEYEQLQSKEKQRGWEMTPCSGKWHIT